MSSREERIAKNEAVSREINESIEDASAARSREGPVRMLCECGRPRCDRFLAITVTEYEEVRRDPRRFVVAKGHVVQDIESPVSETDRYVVVSKREGTPADVAEATDPR